PSCDSIIIILRCIDRKQTSKTAGESGNQDCRALPGILGVALLRISSSHILVVVNQGPGHYTRFRAQQISNQSSYLIRFDQLPHWLTGLSFGQPVFAHVVKLLLSRGLTGSIHPPDQNTVAPYTFGGISVSDVFRECGGG